MLFLLIHNRLNFCFYLYNDWELKKKKENIKYLYLYSIADNIIEKDVLLKLDKISLTNKVKIFQNIWIIFKKPLFLFQEQTKKEVWIIAKDLICSI